MKAKKAQAEIDKIEAALAKIEKEKKWNADNMCKTTDQKTVVSETAAAATPGAEPRLQGEAVAEGYCEFIEEHEELLEKYISMGEEGFEENCEFLKQHGGLLLQ